ncbi:MAG: response regulator [Spirochaetaceae bacterium]|nr:MAG: response regulator [Spirochaetaceae bacterium]
MAYILIVDDDRDFADAAARVLASAGHETEIEPKIEAAIEKMQSRKPELAILDVMFPEDPAAGFELARKVRKIPALGKMPILMLTAVNATFPLGFGPKDINNTWLPISDFLEKPVDFDVLLSKVSGLLEGEVQAAQEA